MSYVNDYAEIFSKIQELKVLMFNFSIKHNKNLLLTMSTDKIRKSLEFVEYENFDFNNEED